ncbi:MAG: excisionase [Sedimenticola sp.]
MYIPLEDWAKTQFNPPPGKPTLRRWARNGQIYPTPVIVGRQYRCLHDATYVPSRTNKIVNQDKLVEKIING